jgi:hypothetical protein
MKPEKISGFFAYKSFEPPHSPLITHPYVPVWSLLPFRRDDAEIEKYIPLAHSF